VSEGRPVPEGGRVDDLDLSGVHLHGVSLEGATLTDAYLRGTTISGDIEGLCINGVDVEPLVGAELDRRFPDRVRLRATDIAGLRDAWSMLEGLWAAATERASRLPRDCQRQRVDGEWSFVETLRHLICATDCWVSRAIELDRHPYHPWGLAFSGLSPQVARDMGLDVSATPDLAEVLPVWRQRQQTTRAVLENLTDAELTEVRTAPEEPGHPNGEHSVLHCLHVILNEEWEHHGYASRDLDALEESERQG
jgi:DinB superfamily/Pentapeptide repeats (8 copies)